MTIELLSAICIFPLMNSTHIQCTQIKGVWCDHAGACSSLINIHHLHFSPDARSTLTFCLICHSLCFMLCCQILSLVQYYAQPLYGCKREVLIDWEGFGGSELFKTLAANRFVNIHLWTDQQICKANEGICQLARSVTLQSALKIDFIMLRNSQLRESHCQVVVLWSNWLTNGHLQ